MRAGLPPARQIRRDVPRLVAPTCRHALWPVPIQAPPPSLPCRQLRPYRRSCRSPPHHLPTSSTSSAIWNAAPRSRPYAASKCLCCAVARPRMAPASALYCISRPVFSACKRVTAGRIQNLPLRDHIDHLPARHAPSPRRGGQRHHQLAACLGIGVGVLLAQDLKRAGSAARPPQAPRSPHRTPYVCSVCHASCRRLSIDGRSSCTSE